MKLRKGKAKYRLPAYSKVLEVRVEGNHAYLIPIVSAMTVIDGQELPPQMPKACAIYGGTIEFSPPPDRPYVVKVRYVPPVMEC